MTDNHLRECLVHAMSSHIRQLTPKLLQAQPSGLCRCARGGTSIRDMAHLRVIAACIAGTDMPASAKLKQPLLCDRDSKYNPAPVTLAR